MDVVLYWVLAMAIICSGCAFYHVFRLVTFKNNMNSIQQILKTLMFILVLLCMSLVFGFVFIILLLISYGKEIISVF